jgi:hypothetical protein
MGVSSQLQEEAKTLRWLLEDKAREGVAIPADIAARIVELLIKVEELPVEVSEVEVIMPVDMLIKELVALGIEIKPVMMQSFGHEIPTGSYHVKYMYKGEYKEGVIRKELLHEFYKTVKKEVVE